MYWTKQGTDVIMKKLTKEHDKLLSIEAGNEEKTKKMG